MLCSSCGEPLTDTTPVTCDAETCKLHLAENDIPIIVDFYSHDCGSYMEMAPDFKKAAASCPLEVRFLKVNTLNDAPLALQYGVNELPTTIAFSRGMEMSRFTSRLSKEQLGM